MNDTHRTSNPGAHIDKCECGAPLMDCGILGVECSNKNCPISMRLRQQVATMFEKRRRSRWQRFKFESRFRTKRLQVCVLCLWYLRHWPMSDLSEAEWRWQLDGATAWDAFLEGWCRD